MTRASLLVVMAMIELNNLQKVIEQTTVLDIEALTAGAALEHGLTHGLSWINWTCAEDNLGSIRTARRLGLQREQDYTMYYFLFDE